MKKLYSIFAVAAISAAAYAQTTIYSENFGTPAATTAVTSYTGYQNGSPITYTGSSDVRSSSASSGYTGASGNGNVFFTGSSGINLVISGINTADYKNLKLSFGELKSTSGANNELTVEVGDGTTWTPLTYTRATGSGTANYILVTPTGNIPAVSNLSIRFVNTSSTAQWRIDDIKLTGDKQVLGSLETNAAKFSFVKNTIVTDEISFAKAADVKVFSVNGQLVKSGNKVDKLNVTSLAKGIYIVTGSVDGKNYSEKIIKK